MKEIEVEFEQKDSKDMSEAYKILADKMGSQDYTIYDWDWLN
jgi:hypothetical protein